MRNISVNPCSPSQYSYLLSPLPSSLSWAVGRKRRGGAFSSLLLFLGKRRKRNRKKKEEEGEYVRGENGGEGGRWYFLAGWWGIRQRPPYAQKHKISQKRICKCLFFFTCISFAVFGKLSCMFMGLSLSAQFSSLKNGERGEEEGGG